jgi:hypothetical protein
MDTQELLVDPELTAGEDRTGIYVRAKDGERWVSVDICRLDKPSLLAWLRSRGGDNPWAENTVGILLGHGPLHPTEASRSIAHHG